MKNESHTAKGSSKMTKNLKGYTILYKNATKFNTRFADNDVHTFLCNALDVEDAKRIFKMSRLYHTTNIHGTKTSRFRRFTIVRVYEADGVGTFINHHGKVERKVRILKSRKPSWMNKSFSR